MVKRTVAPKPKTPNLMTTRDALEIARDRLREYIENGNGNSSEYEAFAIILMILAQRGCEGFDEAIEDGYLTTLMDMVIWG